MCHVITRIVGKACVQLYQGISDDEELCLDGEGQREDEQLLVGEQHSESQQDGIYGSRSSHCGHHVQVFTHGDNARTDVYTGILRQFGHVLYVLHHLLK